MHGWTHFWRGVGSIFNLFPTRTTHVEILKNENYIITEIELSQEELEELQREFDTAFRDLDRLTASMNRAIKRAKERKLNGSKDDMSKAA